MRNVSTSDLSLITGGEVCTQGGYSLNACTLMLSALLQGEVNSSPVSAPRGATLPMWSLMHHISRPGGLLIHCTGSHAPTRGATFSAYVLLCSESLTVCMGLDRCAGS